MDGTASYSVYNPSTNVMKQLPAEDLESAIGSVTDLEQLFEQPLVMLKVDPTAFLNGDPETAEAHPEARWVVVNCGTDEVVAGHEDFEAAALSCAARNMDYLNDGEWFFVHFTRCQAVAA